MLEANYFQSRIANIIVLGGSSYPHYHYEFLSQNQTHRLTLQGCTAMMALCLSVVIFVFFSEKSERAGGFQIAKDKRAPDGTHGPVA